MLKKPACCMLASLRDSTYPRIGVASSLDVSVEHAVSKSRVVSTFHFAIFIVRRRNTLSRCEADGGRLRIGSPVY